MATSRHRQSALAVAAQFSDTPAGRYSGSGEHLAGCGAAIVVLVLSGVAFRWPRSVLMLAVAAAYAAVVVARWLSRLLQVGPVLDRPQVLEIMYLHERRVDESLALLGQWLADEETVTEEATIQGGVVVGAKGFLARLSHNRRRRIARAIRKRPLGNAEERYQRLHDYLRIDAISDDSPTTLQEKTFREFRLVGVLPASDLNADQLYAVGQLQDLGLRVWFRIDKEWRREPFQEFRGELTVVARAVTEPMPDELIGLLPQRNNPPEWRLRPLAIFR